MGRPRKTITREVKEVYSVECIEKTLKITKVVNGEDFSVIMNFTEDGKIGLGNDNDYYSTDYHFHAAANKKTLDRWENVLNGLLAAVELARKELK